MMKQRILSLVLAILLAITVLPVMAEDATAIEADVQGIQKYGNLELALIGKTLMDQGYELGDIVSIELLGETYLVPVGSNYSDVDTGSMVLRVPSEDTNVIWAINMGDLATTLGVATKSTIEEAPGYAWTLSEGIEEPISVAISLNEKGGYLAEYLLHQLTRTNERSDYADLTDEQYANFRNVTTTGMGQGALYRSSSPVNPKLNRNVEADTALNAWGIATVMNLADSYETMQEYEGYAESYYSQRNVIALNLGVDFTADDFKAGFGEGIRYLAANEGPYLVHCTEGKDRAGFTAAVLECLMGATIDEVIADYMLTYYNYYGVTADSEQYDAIVNSNIAKSLAVAFKVDDIREADLAAGAESFLKECGLSDEEIASLKANLSKNYFE